MEKEHYNFVISDGNRAYCFIKAKDKYFISDPDRIVISGPTQIIGIETKKDKVIFTYGAGGTLELDLNSSPEEELIEYIQNMIESFEKSKKRFPISLNPLSGSLKTITIIHVKDFSKAIKLTKEGNLTVSLIPDSLPLEKQKRKHYTKIERENIPINEYISKKGARYKFGDVIKKAVLCI